MPLIHEGIYDLLITESVREKINDIKSRLHIECSDVSEETSAERIAEELGRQISNYVSGRVSNEGTKTENQVRLANSVLAFLRTIEKSDVLDDISSPIKVLKSVSSTEQTIVLPEIGLSAPWLFTASKGSPSLLHELRQEMASCDRLDILVSFITHSGVRKIGDLLQAITAIDSHGVPKSKIRVITTTYTGATEITALNALGKLPGCEIRISLDGRRTRLHAKAWIFHRKTGFGTAYVGSANLSGAALLGGLEWTVKFSERAHVSLYQRAVANFETLWADPEFKVFEYGNEGHQAELKTALDKERYGPDDIRTEESVFHHYFSVEPKQHQLEILEQLDSERAHGRCRNLLVAATGTGKTVVAAFDYRRTCESVGGRPRLLFVAHRKEILQQAVRTYREVLRDNSFGEFLFDGATPRSHDHLFGTIDSVLSRDLLAMHGSGYWHTVVIDECHRMAADRFDLFATTVNPGILLGLTATPERADGQSIFQYFDARPDGGPAAELRLWHALEKQLLVPFEYFACDDDTDLTGVPWNRPGEREVISALVAENVSRANLVVREWIRLAGDPTKSKAVVFCVSVEHARFMTEHLVNAGISAVCVVGETNAADRAAAPSKLRSGEISAIVTVDLYNEGVDLPTVDTLVFLRPTESPVVFQQQLGRGLRLSPGKNSCLVLDFVGQLRSDFRFDRLLSSITGLTKRELIQSVESGFAGLPPGCHIQLQNKAREQIINCLRAQLQNSWRRLKGELISYSQTQHRGSIGLSNFIREQDIDIADIYRKNSPSGWTTLRRDAGIISSDEGPEEEYFSRRFSSLLHTNDPEQIAIMMAACSIESSLLDGPQCATRLQMLTNQIEGQRERIGGYEGLLSRLRAHPAILEELQELCTYLDMKSTLRPSPIPGIEDMPLCLHANYFIREILTASRRWTADNRPRFGEGVLRLNDRKTEFLLVTLDKRDGFHQGIAYQDYAISTSLFHWQTQNQVGPETSVGRRYLEGSGAGWCYQLFVRINNESPYVACGPVTLKEATGEKPMSITWQLTIPLSARLFQEFSILR